MPMFIDVLWRLLYYKSNKLLSLCNTNQKAIIMGAKQKYNEPTVMVSFRCPISKVDEIKKIVNDKLVTLRNANGKIKWSKQDEHLFSKKWVVKKLRGKSHVCRVVESARGKFNVILAQDIIGINCEILFIDGNTLNNERENLKPVNRDVEYFY